MGRGDKKTRRGKISSGTFGVSRPARTKAAPMPVHQQAEAAESNTTDAPVKAAKKPRVKKTEE